ncbi:MAG: hypothetical protein ACTSRI_21845 [Promethearchaeota archaeon]
MAEKHDIELKILLEVDIADKFMEKNVGVLRSPLRNPDDVVGMAREVEKRPHLYYRGIMGYEAQNASLGDTKALIRWVKKRSRKHVNEWGKNINSRQRNFRNICSITFKEPFFVGNVMDDNQKYATFVHPLIDMGYRKRMICETKLWSRNFLI